MKRNHALIVALTALIAGAAMILAGMSRPDPLPSNEYYLDRVKWFEENPAKGRVVFLGDSITARGNWEEALPGCGIVNRAIEYETTAGALARLAEVERVGASVTVVMLGANDITHLEPLPKILKRYRAIIHRLAERSQVIVVSTTLRDRNQTAANAEITALNRALAAECSTGLCRFIDLNLEISEAGYARPEYLVDPVHLSPAAYLRWRDVMRRALECGPPASSRAPTEGRSTAAPHPAGVREGA